jgi:hypothetical protein
MINHLQEAIDMLDIRAPIKVASDACGVTTRTVHNWIKNGCLPRTEYTGETHYAEALAAASGGLFTAAWLLEVTRKR